MVVVVPEQVAEVADLALGEKVPVVVEEPPVAAERDDEHEGDDLDDREDDDVCPLRVANCRDEPPGTRDPRHGRPASVSRAPSVAAPDAASR